MIPRQLSNALRRVLDVPLRLRLAAAHSEIRRCGGSEPVLGFGGVLDGPGLIHGGAVKLLLLREAFRHDDKTFNILYLVSSAQPRFPEDLARLCRSPGIKFVWNQNGVGYPAWAGPDAEKHNDPMRKLRAAADFVVYQSEFCRQSAEKFLGPCPVRSEILFNPVDLEKFSPRTEHLPQNPLRLLAMGTQNYRERVFSALDCLRVLRQKGTDCLLTVAGPLIWKNAENDVRKSVESMELAAFVEFLPSFRQDEAPGIYRAHHILVHPKYMDPCPTVVAEALACGLPIVAPRSGGIPEMTDSACAVLIDVPISWERLHTPSGRQLADAVRQLAGDLSTASRAARQRAETAFDGRVWRGQHARIFRDLLAAS
ncbi:MAG: glycosyltransferase family 4 protein [Chthoniobacterales bacterium]|nr:glycosyltransferase family 4 protein [Chthoniobacterales bacterium]